MNFQGLQTIDSPKEYLDIAILKAKKRADAVRDGKPAKTPLEKLGKSKTIELTKLTELEKSLVSSLDRIIRRFPNLEGLTEFYQELVKVTLDYPTLKKSLGSLPWALRQIKSFLRSAKDKIKRARSIKDVNAHRRHAYGRVSSVVYQIEKNLQYLEHARRVMKDFPSIKEGLFTVCIAGFPNVGKSTLLKHLTSSTPEIKNYAFTTRKLNVGYLAHDLHKLQFVDTPGTLNRKKENDIEKQAQLVLKYEADLIIYVYDPTETYTIEDQETLHKDLKRLRKPMITFASKTDIAKVPKGLVVDSQSVTEIKKKVLEAHSTFLS